ncbi:hypothetical protein [Streptomyces cinereospinus]|uniref:YwqJ-like deaminase n=1 Tax=Streptomyces cinereospinus TaxID=285561 RepID=A0ABV5MX53_9ACTN
MIQPDQIPQFTGDLAQLEKDYAGLKKDAGNVRDAGADVHSQFQGLSAYYQAPEAEKLFATTKPVKDRADAFADDLETVSSALSEYATEVRPLKEKLERLKTDATAFVKSVKDDDEWEYDGDKVEEHNQLRDDITATVAAFWAAERTCHNKIIALVPGGKKVVVGDGSDREGQYGFSAEDMKNARLPWGDPVEEKHEWYEVGHWVKSFVWDGLIVDGIWGTIKGLGTLVGFGGWEAMGQAWKGLAQLATGLALSSIPGVGTMFWSLPEEKLPGWIRDSRTAMKETGKALVAWDQWGKNPARAAGAVTFNVLTTVFTGGAGGAASGAGKAGAVAKALGTTAKVIDPMTYIAKGAGAGLSKIGDISAALKGIGSIDIPALPEGAITLPEGAVRLPDGTVNLPEGAALPEGATRLPDGNVKLPDDATVLPPGTVRLPTEDGVPAQYMDPDGNLLDSRGNTVQQAADGPGDIVDQAGSPPPAPGADTPRVDSPVREPALVGAGTHTADNAAQHVRLGDDGLTDAGRLSDDPNALGGRGEGPGGTADNLPGGTAGNELPGGTAGNGLPGGPTHEHGPGPSASHEPPSGPRDPSPSHDSDSPTPHSRANDGAYSDIAGGPESGTGHGDGHHGHGEHADSRTGDKGAPHDRADDGEQYPDRDVREPRGSLADDAARRAADPLHIGDQPLPTPARGENVLGQLPEHRVTRDADGLITHVDGRNFEHFLKDLSYQRGAAFREAKELGTLSRRQVGACAGQVMDLRTGTIIEGINGKFDNILAPDQVHPTLAANYNALPDPPPAPDHPLGHAEVKAVNALLWERTKLGLPDGEAALAELRAAVEFPYTPHMQTQLSGRPAPFCANCNLMLDGVDSLHGRFTGNPPTDATWIP